MPKVIPELAVQAVATLPAASSATNQLRVQGGKLWWSDGSSWVDLSGSATVTDFQDFTTVGSATWVHPDPGTLYRVYYEIYGGGGGGGGGCARVESVPGSSSSEGGDGGSAGGVHRGTALVTTDQAVVVGDGGNGGNGGNLTTISVTTAKGSNGSPGQKSSFAEFYANGGARGNGGVLAASPSTLNGALPTLYRDGVSTVSNVSYGSTGSHGSGGGNNGSGGVAFGGGASTASIGSTGNGTNGVMANNANAIATNASTPSGQYGSGGPGGGSAFVHSITATRTATAGNGAKGQAGRVRVWAWPANC